MDEYTRVLHCANCGTDFKPSQPLELHGSNNTWGYPCPVCQFQVTARKPARARQILAAGDFETQLSQLLSDARMRGVTPAELMRVLRDELEFAMELGHPGRRMVLSIIDLGEQETGTGAMPVRDLRDVRNSRSLAQ